MHFEKCICAKEYFSVHRSKIPKEGEKYNLCVFIKHLFAWIYFVREKQQGKCDSQKNNHLFSWKRLFFFLITKQSNDGFHLLIQAQGKSYVHQTPDIIWPFWYNDDLRPHSVKAPYFCNPSSAWCRTLRVHSHSGDCSSPESGNPKSRWEELERIPMSITRLCSLRAAAWKPRPLPFVIAEYHVLYGFSLISVLTTAWVHEVCPATAADITPGTHTAESQCLHKT